MNPEDPEEPVADIAESVRRLQDKYRNIFKKMSEHERDHRRMLEQKADLETRLRVLESYESKLEDEISDIDKRLRNFELTHDKRKENWNMVVNFVIQLVWVAMAAFMLSKLGLQAPL